MVHIQFEAPVTKEIPSFDVMHRLPHRLSSNQRMRFLQKQEPQNNLPFKPVFDTIILCIVLASVKVVDAKNEQAINIKIKYPQLLKLSYVIQQGFFCFHVVCTYIIFRYRTNIFLEIQHLTLWRALIVPFAIRVTKDTHLNHLEVRLTISNMNLCLNVRTRLVPLTCLTCFRIWEAVVSQVD